MLDNIYIKFADAMEATGFYKKSFIKRMREAENDLRKGHVKKFESTEEFLKSLL